MNTGAGRSNFTISIFLALLGAILTSQGYSLPETEDYNSFGSEPFGIRIESVINALQGHRSFVHVTKQCGSEEMLGFKFMIAYDASALASYGATPGEIFDSTGQYQWEYFSCKFNPIKDSAHIHPSGLLRIEGMADIDNGAHHPVSHEIIGSLSLFSLDFYVSNDITLECQFVPIRFYWIDCDDNSITMKFRKYPGDTLMAVSHHVYDFTGDDITDSLRQMGGYGGIPPECLAPSDSSYESIRFIDFYDGGIDIHCTDSIGYRGDIDFDGSGYGLGDLVLFGRYFTEGIGVFVNEAQISATDINQDGVPLTREDYLLLLGLVLGFIDYEMELDSTINGTIRTFSEDSVIILNVGAEAPLRVMRLVLYAPDLVTYSVTGGSAERIGDSLAITDIGWEAPLDLGMIRVSYSGSTPTLTRCWAAGDKAQKVNFIVSDATLPRSFVLHQNFPNPFNSATMIKFNLPSRQDWRIDIFNIIGQTVRSFSGDEMGFKSILWDGRDNDNRELPSGVYFYRLKADDFSSSKKMILLK